MKTKWERERRKERVVGWRKRKTGRLGWVDKNYYDSSVGKESAGDAGDPQLDSWVGKIHCRRDRLPTPVFLGFLCGSAGQESACNVDQ